MILEKTVFAPRARAAHQPVVLHACFEPISHDGQYTSLSGYGQAVSALDHGLRGLGLNSIRVVPDFTTEHGRGHLDIPDNAPLFLIRDGSQVIKIAAVETRDVWDAPLIVLRNIDKCNYFAFRPYGKALSNHLFPGRARTLDQAGRVFNSALYGLAKAIRQDLAPQQKLIFHGHDHLTGLAAARAARKGIPTVFTVHNPAYTSLAPLDLVRSLGFELPEGHSPVDLLTLAIAHAHLVTTVSPAYQLETTSDQFDYGPERQKYAPLLRQKRDQGRFLGILNGLLPHFFPPDGQTGAGHRRRSEQVIGVLLANRLVPQKGYDLLVGGLRTALETYRREGIKVRFTISGRGDDEIADKLARLRSADAVDFHPYWGEELMFDDLASSKLALLPSRFEPCGQFLMTAQAHGVLTLGTNTGGLKDILGVSDSALHPELDLSGAGLIGGAYGLLFNSTYPAALTPDKFWQGLDQVIRLLHQDAPGLKELALAGRQRALAHYTAQRMAADYQANAYEPLLRQTA